MKIVLVRHGEPIIPTLTRIRAADFGGWVDQCNAAGLDPKSAPTKHVRQCASGCNVIVCSDLPRSIESAACFQDRDIILSEPLFIEAGMPSANWKTLRMSPKTWAVVFRIFWFLGYSRGSESLKEAKARASQAVEKLIDVAREHENVLFVGHGLFNRLLANELRRQGWRGPRNPGTAHWAYGVYER